MARRRRSLEIEFADHSLERRELLSQLAGPPFHHQGINGLKLHQDFINVLNTRVSISASQEARISQAFNVFVQSATPNATGPTLDSLIGNLTREVTYALTVREILTVRPSPSVAHGPKIAHAAQRVLVPFAVDQINQMGATIAASPTSVTTAAGTAFNAISNAIAEYSIHPALFTQPSDFYISPDFQFPLTYTAAPADSSPGFFVRGPGGVILPGATLHPHYPA